MRCSKCGYVNPGESIRCGNCGTPLSGWAGLRALGTGLQAAPGTAQAPRATTSPAPLAPSSPSSSTAAGEIPTYMFRSALAVLASIPFGLAALFFSAQVKMKLATGDLAAARRSSRMALALFWVAMVAGFFTWMPKLWDLLLKRLTG